MSSDDQHNLEHSSPSQVSHLHSAPTAVQAGVVASGGMDTSPLESMEVDAPHPSLTAPVPGEDEDEEMPELQSVSNSSDSGGESDSDDSDAEEVEAMQNLEPVDDDNDSQWEDMNVSNTNNNNEEEDEDMPPLEPIRVAPTGRSSNRRTRVEDDDDEDRDRRHPSQRTAGITTAADVSPSFLATHTPQPVPQPAPQPAAPPRNPRPTMAIPVLIRIERGGQPTRARAFNNPAAGGAPVPGFNFANPFIFNVPQANATPAEAQAAHAQAHAQAHARAQGPPPPAGPNPTQGIPPQFFNGAPGANPWGAFPPGPAAGGPGNLADGEAFAQLLNRFGVGLSQVLGLNVTMGGANGIFPMGGFGPFFAEEEKEDPERAKKLVDGLEEVPIGLVRRLEALQSLSEEGEQSPGCAICWDRLLDSEGDGFGTPSHSNDSNPADPSLPPSDPSSPEAKQLKIVTLPCAHVFHASCLLPWFSRPRQTTCPTCRFNIDPENLTYVRRRPTRTNAPATAPGGTAAPGTTAPNPQPQQGDQGQTQPMQNATGADILINDDMIPPTGPRDPSGTAQPGDAPAQGTNAANPAAPQPPVQPQDNFFTVGFDMFFGPPITFANAPANDPEPELPPLVDENAPDPDLPDLSGDPEHEIPPLEPLRPASVISVSDTISVDDREDPMDIDGDAMQEFSAMIAQELFGAFTMPPPNPVVNPAPAPAPAPAPGPQPQPLQARTQGSRGWPAFGSLFGTAPLGTAGVGLQTAAGGGINPTPIIPLMHTPGPAAAPPPQQDIDFERDFGQWFNPSEDITPQAGQTPAATPAAPANGGTAPQQPQGFPQFGGFGMFGALPPWVTQGGGGTIPPNNATGPTAAGAGPGAPRNTDANAPPPPWFNRLFDDMLMNVGRATGAPAPGTGPPPPPGPRKQWTLPNAPGPTLRQRVEQREREAGFRCHDVSCGVGPSDEDPVVNPMVTSMKQLSIRPLKEDFSIGASMVVCPHTFHAPCLVTSERIALRGMEEKVMSGGKEVEVGCPVCRASGAIEKEEWDEGVEALV